MKKTWILGLLTLCVLLLAACGGESGEDAQQPEGAAQEEIGGAETARGDGASSAQQGTAADGDMPDTVTLDATTPIFDAPGYDGCYRRIVGEDGVYTIVETADDEEGNRWGRLKSGAGWVDLTAAEAFFREPPVLTVCYAEEPLLAGAVMEQIVDDSAYMERIALRSRQSLADVRLYAVELGEAGLSLGEELYALETLPAGTALVLGVTFPGDMSMYAIACRDSGGAEHCYTVSVSGRNGALVLADFAA